MAMNEIQTFNERNLTIPINKVKIARSLSTELPDYLTKDEVDKLLSVITNKSHYLLIEFLWKTGCRITEALSITKGSIDFENRTIRIRWLKKRKALERIIPLHPSLAYNLSVFAGSLNLQDRMFPITRQRAYQITKDYAVKAQIGKPIHPHTLRHSFAVYFLKQRRNIVALQKLLGHSQITTTMIYLNIVQQDLADEINMMEY
ncbi:MAG: tyrosine-type recombinase/integrase [Nanoarchaeota archaeon]|nr:tyrosine-type recombinase/integrase [Nanoarchaeota archaeon]